MSIVTQPQHDANGLDPRRQNYVTASEVAQILGISPWGNAADVWHRKVYGEERGDRGNKSTDLGNMLEPVVIQWGLDHLGYDIPRQLKAMAAWGMGQPSEFRYQEFVCNDLNSATLDCRIVATNNPMEGKTHGIAGPAEHGSWGDAGTDQVPDYYVTQMQTQLMVCDAEIGYLPAIIGGRGPVMFRINRDEGLCRYIRQQSEIFWKWVDRKKCPPDLDASLETLKRIRRKPESVTVIADPICLDYVAKQAEFNEAKKAADLARARVLQALGDNEAGECHAGTMTYFADKRGTRTLRWKAKR